MRLNSDRQLRTLLGSAALLAILGAGNMLFGTTKLEHYEKVLSRAPVAVAIGEDGMEGSAEQLPDFATDPNSRSIARLRARVGFYSFVVHGGKVLLALSGAALLGSLIRLRRLESRISGS